MNTDPLKSYRESSVHGSSAADIYIQCYDEVVRLLHSAARAIEAGDIEKKTHDLNRALSFIVHLQSALGVARGGEGVRWLTHFYLLVSKQIFEGSARLEPELLRQAAGYFVEVRKTWEEVPTINSQNPASNPSPSPHDNQSQSPQTAAPAITPDIGETSTHIGWSA